ncbi:MAG: HlyD family secretion protein [Gammaproteobacteria bacterium]
MENIMDATLEQPSSSKPTHWQQVKKTAQNDFKKITLWTLIIISIAIAGYYWWYTHHYVSTDDAYVNANVLQMAPQITGQVQSLNIINNEYVQKGTVLFTIDPAPYIVAVQEAQAELEMNVAKMQIASLIAKRNNELLARQAVSQQDTDISTANFKSAYAAVDLSKAQLARAQLNLSYTTVTAPTNGWVSNMSLRAGDIVTQDLPLFAFISDDEFWIDTNFKETDLRYVQLGQEAVIENDVYPGKQFKGVESISGAAGNAFSLLPPQNATGNWVKITQRVPVRVRVVDPDPKFPLRVGTSSSVTIRFDKKPVESAQAGIAK